VKYLGQDTEDSVKNNQKTKKINLKKEEKPGTHANE